jgi:anti-sigma factor RsiW
MEESMSTDARPSALVHATEELLEEYTFGRIREPQLGWLEEHLLICPECQSELDDIEEYKVFMKAGLAAFESERLAAVAPVASPARPGSPVRPRSSVREEISLHFAWPRMPGAKSLLAAAALLVVAGTAVTWWMQSSSMAMAPVATIRLVALRGGEGDVARATSGRPLELVFDRRDLAADLSYRAEVVHSSGRQVWSGSVRIGDQNLSVRVDGPLPAGAYWVRLYTSAGQLLREFGLKVG